MITDTGTSIIHQNEVRSLWITSLLLKIVTVSLNSNVPPSNEGMYTCQFCQSIMSPFWMPMLDYTQVSGKGENRLIRVNNFTASSILIRLNAFRLSSIQTHKGGFKRQTLCQWRGSKNRSDEVAQRTVNRILQGRDTYSHSKEKYCYWEKRWLCRRIVMWSTEDQLHFDVWYMFLCQ